MSLEPKDVATQPAAGVLDAVSSSGLADAGRSMASPAAHVAPPQVPARRGPDRNTKPVEVSAWPALDHASFGPVRSQVRSRIQRLTAANLHRNWVTIPHVTNHDEVDITSLDALRRRINSERAADDPKVTLLPFLVMALVATLRIHPKFNMSLEEDRLVQKDYFHVGMAVDTPGGLLVPVITEADKLDLDGLVRRTTELAARARSGKLKPAEMTGGCMTLSSLGGLRGTHFTPIVNAPEVAILGVSTATVKPQWDGQAFAPRLMLPLSLSWDHRVLDGASVARFFGTFADALDELARVPS